MKNKKEIIDFVKNNSYFDFEGEDGTFKLLGTAKELGITPKIDGHDMIAECDCGEKFSYQNSKKNILWQCPECKGMKRIDENVDNIIFVRTKNFDNTGTLNKLPYDGIQCWAIYENDLDKYIVELELWGGKKKNVEIINPSGHDIFALNYPMTHKYVMGETDEIPELIPFNKNEHIMRYIKQSGKSMLDYVSELGMGKMCYQILLK